jgi:hypothetical protein
VRAHVDRREHLPRARARARVRVRVRLRLRLRVRDKTWLGIRVRDKG